jgi:drug/metabolite transporter (DMT)-like permease
MAFLRVAVATLFLGGVLWWRGIGPDLRGRGGRMTLMALTNTAAPFFLFSYATIHLSAGYGSLLNATTPLMGILMGLLAFGYRPQPRVLVGVGIGFVGVLLLVLGKLHDVGLSALLPALAGLLATACYGHAAHYARTAFTDMPALALAFGSQLFSSLWLLPPALASWPAQPPSLTAWACVTVLGVLCTGVAYAIYFGLITRIGSTRATMVTYLAPVFGVSWGALFLDERITLAMLVGGGVIFLGIAVANGLGRRPA